MKREPLLTIGTVTSVAAAVLALLVAFGAPLTEGQQQGLLGLVGTLAPAIVALLARRRVSPVAEEKRRPPRRRRPQPDREPEPAGAAIT